MVVLEALVPMVAGLDDWQSNTAAALIAHSPPIAAVTVIPKKVHQQGSREQQNSLGKAKLVQAGRGQNARQTLRVL